MLLKIFSSFILNSETNIVSFIDFRMIIFEQREKNMRKIKQILLAGTLIIGVFSCSNELDVDISASTYSLQEIRIENLLNQPNIERSTSLIASQYKESPEIIEYLLYYCYKTGMPTDSVFEFNWNEFKNNPYFNRLSKEINQSFKNVSTSTKKIEDGFKRVQVHLPNAKLPKQIIYMNSYFASSVYCTEETVAIGLERYLGANNPVIQELPSDVFYDWIKKAMNKEFLERDAVCAWILTHVCEPAKDKNNIETFIQWGKILYATKTAFPFENDRMILRYSDENYQWALKNERNVWEYLVKQNMLFQKSETDQAAFLQEAPFTSGLPQKGPDRLGQFIGYRIICSYMDQYHVTLQDLLEKPYNEILSEYEIND